MEPRVFSCVDMSTYCICIHKAAGCAGVSPESKYSGTVAERQQIRPSGSFID